MNADNDRFIQLVRHRVKFRLYLLVNLPAAFFSGVRVQYIDGYRTVVTIPYKWFSQNPFRSTYFACLAMAAEMSTGLLGMLHTYKNTPAVSMLVTGLEANFLKKATAITTFTCEDGDAIKDGIISAIARNEGRSIKTRSVGRNKDSELVAEFFITWSFKAKQAGGMVG